MATWGMAQAKAQFSEVIHEAEKIGPQTISRSGREVAVVVSIEEWQKHRDLPEDHVEPGIGTMYDLLMNSPLPGSGLVIPKLKPKKKKLL